MRSLRGFRADLHIHTVASACAEIEMLPPLIVERARQLGLDLIAITDHNSAVNVAAVCEAAHESDLVVWPGIGCRRAKRRTSPAYSIAPSRPRRSPKATIEGHLPHEENPEAFFGVQLVVDAQGEFLRKDALLRQVAVASPWRAS